MSWGQWLLQASAQMGEWDREAGEVFPHKVAGARCGNPARCHGGRSGPGDLAGSPAAYAASSCCAPSCGSLTHRQHHHTGSGSTVSAFLELMPRISGLCKKLSVCAY